MKHVRFTVSEAIGGYTINIFDEDAESKIEFGDCHVATSREGVGKVVVKLCDDAFAEKGSRSKNDE